MHPQRFAQPLRKTVSAANYLTSVEMNEENNNVMQQVK